MYSIGIKRQFSAAHRLDGHPGRCSNLHGHTWTVEAVFTATDVGESGMVVDFEEAGAALDEAVGKYDHVCLNDVEPFDSVPPTAENVARVIFGILRSQPAHAEWPARLESVSVWESADARATYGE
jgi:6-pyruvoyltetrahydropterin/6-carboxytetrahydropterin synthase